jgi:hypothetical protein
MLVVAPADGQAAAASAASAAAASAADDAFRLSAGAATPAEMQRHLAHPSPQAPPLVVDDRPAAAGNGKKDKKKGASRAASYTFSGEVGLELDESASGGKVVVSALAPGGAAEAQGVLAGSVLLALNGQKLIDLGLSRGELSRLVETAPRPLVLRIQAPKAKKEPSAPPPRTTAAAEAEARSRRRGRRRARGAARARAHASRAPTTACLSTWATATRPRRRRCPRRASPKSTGQCSWRACPSAR